VGKGIPKSKLSYSSRRKEMMQNQSFVKSFQEAQDLVIQYCEQWMTLNRLETLLGLKRRNESLAEGLNKKNPFTTSRFEIALDKFSRYMLLFKGAWC
jgi:hypothetical protein